MLGVVGREVWPVSAAGLGIYSLAWPELLPRLEEWRSGGVEE